MKIIVKLIVFVSLILSLLVDPTTIACTIITASNGEKVMFGGNEDQTFKNRSFLVVDTSGKFGVVYFATPWKEMPLVTIVCSTRLICWM